MSGRWRSEEAQLAGPMWIQIGELVLILVRQRHRHVPQAHEFLEIASELGTAASAFLFGNSGTGLDAFLYAALLSFFNLGAWGVLYTVTPELYPTGIRTTGAGIAAAVGRIGGIIGPFLTPVLVPTLGQSGVFAMFMVVLLVTAVNVLLFAEETKGKSLEQISGLVSAEFAS